VRVVILVVRLFLLLQLVHLSAAFAFLHSHASFLPAASVVRFQSSRIVVLQQDAPSIVSSGSSSSRRRSNSRRSSRYQRQRYTIKGGACHGAGRVPVVLQLSTSSNILPHDDENDEDDTGTSHQGAKNSKKNDNVQEQVKNDSNDDNDPAQEQVLFFDDFDFTAGDTDSNDLDADTWMLDIAQTTMTTTTAPESLLALPEFQKVLTEESKRKNLIERNWEQGNWKCRGFSLDRERPDSMMLVGEGKDDENENDQGNDDDNINDGGSNGDDDVVKISQIAFDETVTTSSTTADSLLGFGASTEMIAVGRTDGTVYVVTLGEEYLTKFRARLLLQGGTSGNGYASNANDDNTMWKEEEEVTDGQEDEFFVPRFEMEMVNEEEIGDSIVQSKDLSNVSSLNPSLSPFVIECQFQAHGRDEPISSLLFHDETLYTASSKTSGGGSSSIGQIKSWKMDHVDGKAVVMPSYNLDGAHMDKIVALKTLSHKNNIMDASDHNLLLSASRDGSFAMWDMNNGDLVYRCQILMNEDGNDVHVSINCADVDTSSGSGDHFIYFGLSDGYVVGYSVSELLDSASEGNTCNMPKCRFLAHDPLNQSKESNSSGNGVMGVTAISFGGPGNSSQTTLSSMLVTGGADGRIKQWEMLQYTNNSCDSSSTSTSTTSASKDSNGSSWKLVHWPRMPTQKLKGRAHLFQGHHDGPITTVKCDMENNTSKIISAGTDGSIRVWNPKSGTELYRMDGFDDLTSICLDKEILVTNGMKEYVCIHDFDVDEDLDKRYDLDW